jgi:hypothetical protein
MQRKLLFSYVLRFSPLLAKFKAALAAPAQSGAAFLFVGFP